MSVAAQAKLSSRQREFLLGRGYLVVRSLLDQAVLARIRDRLDGLVRVTVAAWANDPSLDTTASRACTRITPNAGPKGRGRRCRP